MFNKETLFILGAGASVPYGYPVGTKLITDIITDMGDKILLPINSLQSGRMLEIVGDPKYSFNKNDAAHDNYYDLDKFIGPFDDITKKKLLEDGRLLRCSQENADEHYYQLAPYDLYETTIDNIKQFRELKVALRAFNPISIDTFLRDNPSHAVAGKIMINYSLLKKEQLKEFEIENQDDWYRYLLNDMSSQSGVNPESLLQNKVSFITFNYDLSLDYYLYNRLLQIEQFQAETGGKQIGKQFWETLSKERIKHVYGQLYPHELLDKYGQFGSNDSSKNNLERFLFALENKDQIKLMQEDRKILTSQFESFVKKAEEIIVIGFAFDRSNLDVLGFPVSERGYKDFNSKKIKILNFKGEMTHLKEECDNIEKHAHLNENTFKISTAEKIIHAYQNDFKTHLY